MRKGRNHITTLGRLVPFEIRKIFSSPFLKILVVLLLILNILMCAYASYTPSYDVDTYYDALYRLYHDDPDYFLSEYSRIEKANSELGFFDEPSSAYGDGRYDDLSLFRHVYDIVMADRAYHETLGDLISQAARLRQNLMLTGNEDSYMYRYQTAVIDIYSHLDDTVVLEDTYVTGWNEYFSYNADYFLVLIFVSVLTAFIALGDRSSGFHTIISTCESGREHTVLAKYIAVLLSTVLVVVAFTASTFLSAGATAGGYSDMMNAAQSAESLTLYPLKTTLGGALAIDLTLKIVSASIFMSIVFAAAMILKNTVLAVGTGVGVMTLCYYASFADVLKTEQWKFLNLWSIYYANQYTARFRAVDIFGSCVPLTVVIVAIFVFAMNVSPILSVLLANSSGISMRRCNTRMMGALSNRIAQVRNRHGKRGSLSVTFYELYKQRSLTVFLLILIVLKVIATADYYESGSTVYDRAYKKYIDEIGGEWTPEKSEKLAGDMEYYEKIVSGFDSIGQEYWNGNISETEFQKLYSEYLGAATKIEVLGELTSRSEYLKELYETRGIRGSFIYDTGYYKMANQGVDWLLLMFVCVFSIRIYLFEHTKTSSGTPMLMLVAAAEHGRLHLFRRKLAVCAVSTAAVWCVFRIVDFIFLSRAYDMPDMAAPCLSMPRYGGAIFDFSIGEYITIITAASLIGTLTISFLCFSLGLLLKRAIFSYPIAALIIAVPHFIVSTGIAAAELFDITSLFDTDKLYCLTLFSLPMPIYGIIFFTVILGVSVAAVSFSAIKIKRWHTA